MRIREMIFFPLKSFGFSVMRQTTETFHCLREFGVTHDATLLSCPHSCQHREGGGTVSSRSDFFSSAPPTKELNMIDHVQHTAQYSTSNPLQRLRQSIQAITSGHVVLTPDPSLPSSSRKQVHVCIRCTSTQGGFNVLYVYGTVLMTLFRIYRHSAIRSAAVCF